MSGLAVRTAAHALDRIPAGTHIVSAPGMGAPTTVLNKIAERSAGRRWTLSSGLLLGDYPFLQAVQDGHLTYKTWHVMPPVRDLVADGVVGYVPVRASHISDLLGSWAVGAALVRISPPDGRGYCSLGPSVGYAMAALRTAVTLIGEVDPSVPRTCGDTRVHVSVFDSLVETETAIPTYTSALPNEVSTRVAQRVLELLPKQPTLQIGIGAIPETLVRSLPGADLGGIRFVGMATDAMVDLFEVGLLRADDVVPTPAVLSPDMMGTEKLLEFSHDNPAIGMYPSSFSHDCGQLGLIDRFVSINTAVEVDLFGNVNSEVVGGRQISGPGGGLDYIDSATRSRGGLRVMALPSASSDGRISRIVPRLSHVTVPRSMVDVIVTENGVARLDGLTTRERAEALIALAHPDQQQALREAAFA